MTIKPGKYLKMMKNIFWLHDGMAPILLTLSSLRLTSLSSLRGKRERIFLNPKRHSPLERR